MKAKTLSTKIDGNLFKNFEAAKGEMSSSSFLRFLIAEQLKKQRSEGDNFARLLAENNRQLVEISQGLKGVKIAVQESVKVVHGLEQYRRVQEEIKKRYEQG